MRTREEGDGNWKKGGWELEERSGNSKKGGGNWEKSGRN